MVSKRVREQLSVKYSEKFPLTSKRKNGLILGGFWIPPFVFLMPLMARHSRGGDLIPIWIALTLSICWHLLSFVGHRVTELTQYEKMSEREKSMCLFYDSFRFDLVRTGIGVYVFISSYWAVVEIGLGNGYGTLAAIILIVCGIIAVVFLWQREWVAQVAIDGLSKHDTARNVIAIVFGLFSVLPLLPGVVSMLRVTARSSLEMMAAPSLISLFAILALSVTLMTLLGGMITYSHYEAWQLERKRCLRE